MSAASGRRSAGRGRLRRHAVPLALLVPALAAFTWTASSDARAGWWLVENHVPVRAGADGWARMPDVVLRLTEVERVRVLTTDFDGPWSPPPGYALWRVGVEARSDLAEPRYCDFRVVDERGRSFSAPEGPAAVPGTYSTTLDCGGGVTEEIVAVPGEDEEEQAPRPGQYVNEAYVLLPTQARPVEVRVFTTSRDGGFGPAYAALPVPDED
ncbi:hypothetical protein [Actinotalea sp. JY-7876]|uniref:hypothetical protein n=1 Tax=Actinotalea sp. JY-7876 TaxID=2758442 RepID=UPI0015F60276|nr:hypothetical protein [Actinotalea sp. JY-7876]